MYCNKYIPYTHIHENAKSSDTEANYVGDTSEHHTTPLPLSSRSLDLHIPALYRYIHCMYTDIYTL